jgi:U3 small nucleolar ribonucleoprotein protein IMP4
VEDKERTILERKRKVREALEEGKPIPTELRNEEAKLRDALAYDDEEHEGEVLV